jgi:hypothetical protein
MTIEQDLVKSTRLSGTVHSLGSQDRSTPWHRFYAAVPVSKYSKVSSLKDHKGRRGWGVLCLFNRGATLREVTPHYKLSETKMYGSLLDGILNLYF